MLPVGEKMLKQEGKNGSPLKRPGEYHVIVCNEEFWNEKISFWKGHVEDKDTLTQFYHGGSIADPTATCKSFLGRTCTFPTIGLQLCSLSQNNIFCFVFRRLKTFYEFILIPTRQLIDQKKSIILSCIKTLIKIVKNRMIIEVNQQHLVKVVL